MENGKLASKRKSQTWSDFPLEVSPDRSYNPLAGSHGSALRGIRILNAETLLALGKVIISGALTAVLAPLAYYFTRYYWDRRRWHAFEGLIRDWTREEFFPEDMTESDWHALVATKLSESGFEPVKVNELLQLGVWSAKGRVSQEIRGRVSLGQKHDQEDETSGESK